MTFRRHYSSHLNQKEREGSGLASAVASRQRPTMTTKQRFNAVQRKKAKKNDGRSRPGRDTQPTSMIDSVLPPHIANQEEQFSFLLGEDFVEKHNVAWRVELATDEAANPLMEPEFPWESAAVFSHGTVLIDPIDGLWKAWYISAKQTKLQSSAERRLCYAESEDGLHWTRPKLDICSYPGYRRTNILLDIKSGGSARTCLGNRPPGSAARMALRDVHHPAAGWEHPYKVVQGFALPEDSSTHAGGKGEFKPGYFRYRSSDGKKWIPWEVVSLETSDSGWISQLADGSYVAYHKAVIPSLPGALVPYDIAAGVCRIMVRRTSPDGTNWTQYQPVVTPDWQDPQDTQFMELTPLVATWRIGRPGYRLSRSESNHRCSICGVTRRQELVAAGSPCMRPAKGARRPRWWNDLADASDDSAQRPHLSLLFGLRRTAQRLSEHGPGGEDEGCEVSPLATLLGTTDARQGCVQSGARRSLVFRFVLPGFLASRPAMGRSHRNRRGW